MNAGAPKRLTMRGRVVFRVRAGEDPVLIPDHADVARGAAHALLRFEGGAVERVLRRFSSAMSVARVFPAASGRLGTPSRRWDDLEVTTGLSRTFRADLDPDVDLAALVRALVSSTSSRWLRPTTSASSIGPWRRGPRRARGETYSTGTR
jgi:hypothetical protein